MSTGWCTVQGCPGRQHDVYHTFPEDEDLSEEWLRLVKSPNSKKPILHLLSSRVCSLHFADDDYNKEVESEGLKLEHLKPTAIPSIFPWTESWPLNEKVHFYSNPVSIGCLIDAFSSSNPRLLDTQCFNYRIHSTQTRYLYWFLFTSSRKRRLEVPMRRRRRIYWRARRRQMPRQLNRISAAPLATSRREMCAAGRTIVVITKKLIAIGATNVIIPRTIWNNWKSTVHGTMSVLPKVAHLQLVRDGPLPQTLPVEPLERLPDKKL